MLKWISFSSDREEIGFLPIFNSSKFDLFSLPQLNSKFTNPWLKYSLIYISGFSISIGNSKNNCPSLTNIFPSIISFLFINISMKITEEKLYNIADKKFVLEIPLKKENLSIIQKIKLFLNE